ncbi:hypothetical protein QW131_02810 [Roseibium salinum]|nr:hypothetical protein [Roseibium salinum]
MRNVLKRDKSAAAAEADQEPADDLELAVEDIADKAFEANDATVLPGDRPAPENTPSPGGRRRAILYTAAAVVLLIGTLQVFRLAGDAPDEGADLAAVTPEKVETVEVAPASEETDLTAAAAEATAQEKGSRDGGRGGRRKGSTGTSAHRCCEFRLVSHADSEPGSPGGNVGRRLRSRHFHSGCLRAAFGIGCSLG